MTEYVKLESDQQVYGKKALLFGELQILESKKTFKRYLEIKKQERSLKKLLKSTIKELKTDIHKLESNLPTTKETKPSINLTDLPKKRKGLDEEIQAIKRKIEALSE